MAIGWLNRLYGILMHLRAFASLRSSQGTARSQLLDEELVGRAVSGQVSPEGYNDHCSDPDGSP